MADIRNYVRHMGENKRYGFKNVDPALNDAVTRPKPISLTPAEIGATAVPDASEPHEVIAWVRYPEASVRVRGRAVAWTDRAVWVEFTTYSGATTRAWVWASAVSRP